MSFGYKQRELAYVNFRNRRKFNPLMISEWWSVRLGKDYSYYPQYAEPQEEHIWCAESCKGRWSNGNNEEVHWRALKRIGALGDREVFSTFFFKRRSDAVRFLCLFT